MQEGGSSLPKPLVPVGSKPILWHVLSLYRRQGYSRFVLCTGFKADLVAEFAAESAALLEAEIVCHQTEVDTPTGGRVKLAEELIGQAEPFFLTYADGLASIDLAALTDFHGSHKGSATVTCVQPRLQFGLAKLDADRVVEFTEKPKLSGWVNGGFFYLEPEVFKYLRQDSVFETDGLGQLAASGELFAYKHDGFWQCMDTYKDMLRLNDLVDSGKAPWLQSAETRYQTAAEGSN